MGTRKAMVQHLCPWRKFVAICAAALTAGVWVPFVTYGGTPDRSEDEDDETSFSIPPFIHEGHPVPNVPHITVDLVKKPAKVPPKKVTTGGASPTHAKPTPKHTVKPPPVATKPTSALISFLRAQIGDRYVLGGNGPDIWDCSGLTKAAYARAYNIVLPRTSEMQSLKGHHVSLGALQTGDLLFWGAGPGLAYHVAIYIGNGRYIAAQNPSVGVVERSLSYSPPDFARRIL